MTPDTASPPPFPIGSLTSLDEWDYIESTDDLTLAQTYAEAYTEWRDLVAGQETMRSFRDYLLRAISYHVENS